MKNMKKTMYFLLIATAILALSACGKNTADDLQSKKWNVVATNGEAYSAEFNKDTVSFKAGSFNRGFSYTVNEDEISLVEDGEEPVVFEIKKDDNEYHFKATTDAIKDQFGDLTLSPSKD